MGCVNLHHKHIPHKHPSPTPNLIIVLAVGAALLFLVICVVVIVLLYLMGCPNNNKKNILPNLQSHHRLHKFFLRVRGRGNV